ncbi:MAG: methyltransferase [Paracoccaceae bacterium]|nr:methyltransferase [Paracoccaceae bacterium]
MRFTRLTFALDSGALSLPATGEIVVFRPRAGDDLSCLPKARLLLVQGFRPDHDAFLAQGYRVLPALEPGALRTAALVCLPRSKAEAHALLAQAAAAVVPGGPIIVDGQKTDGVDSILRDLRARGPVSEPVSKAHGKLFCFAAGDGLADWAAVPKLVEGGFWTDAGVFSAEGPDRGSALLAAALPAKLPGRVVDLGAGWGYLSQAILAREGVRSLDLVEAEAAALACARRNITDPRAQFHWADATTFRPERGADAVVCNPPFHTMRDADPGLGAAFIVAAARILAPHGTLWLVANRHLPYDRVLTPLFREIEDIGGDASFRLTRAARPNRPPRA